MHGVEIAVGQPKKMHRCLFLHDCRAEKCPDNQEQKPPVRGSERRSSVAGDSSIPEQLCCSLRQARAARVEHRCPAAPAAQGTEDFPLEKQRGRLQGRDPED